MTNRRVAPTTLQGKPCLGLKDAAAHLGLATSSKAAVWRKVQAGSLRGLQDDRGRWFVPVAELDRYLAQVADTSTVGVREAAELLGVAVTTVRRWVRHGVLTGAQDARGRWSFERKTVSKHATALVVQREGLTGAQAVRFCGVGSVATLNAAVERGELVVFIDANGRRRFDQASVERFVAGREKRNRRSAGTLSSAEAAEVLGLASYTHMGWLAEHGLIDRVRVGRYWRYPAKAVHALKKKRDKVQGKGEAGRRGKAGTGGKN